MAQLHESSGLLSLSALREHEKKQAQQQIEAVRARAEAEQRARLEAERETARVEQARKHAEALARAQAESARDAERLRLEAANDAGLQRADALGRTCDELRRELSTEREARRSAELVSTSKLLRQRLLTQVSVALCVGMGVAAGALYFGVLRPATERTILGAERATLAEREARREIEANLARSTRSREELALRVGALEQALRDARNSAGPASAALPHRLPLHRPASPPPAGTGPCPEDGDPLNPCMKR